MPATSDIAPQSSLSPQAMADILCTILVLCRGTDANNTPFWAYMCVRPSMAKIFKEARDRGDVDLASYGTILEAGEGKDVPDEVKQRMERDFGVNHNFENDLIAAVERIKQETA